MTLSITSVDKPEAIRVISKEGPLGVIAATRGEKGPPGIGEIIFCTGTAVLDFRGDHDTSRDDLEFPIPDDSGNPLVIEGGRLFIDAAATASLASISGGEGLWAVDNVDVFEQEVGGKQQVFLKAALAVDDGLHIFRVAYQVTIFLGLVG